MPIAKKRKKNGKVVKQKFVEPSRNNPMARLAGAGNIKPFQKTSFEMRETENRRARAKALSEGKADPFKMQEEEWGSVYGVGDKVKNPVTKVVRRIVEVSSNKGEISYAWISDTDTGFCSEKTMIRFSK